MKRAALYVRVSTDEQKEHGISIDSQIDALERYCEANDLYIVGVYNDAGFSARKKYTTRPALIKLLADCRAGKIDMILFTRLDRWFRSVSDYHLVQAVLDECKVFWRTIWEEYETETAAGVFKVNIMLAVSQSEADKTSERIRNVKEFQRAQGRFVGGLIPFGYSLDKASGQLIYNDAEKEAVAGMFATYIGTHNLNRVVDYVEAKIGRRYSREGIRNMLKADYYRGEHKGLKVPPYLSTAQAAQLDKILVDNKWVSNRPKRTYLFSGILVCGNCGYKYNGFPHKCKTLCKDGWHIYQVKTYNCGGYKRHTGCKCCRTVYENTLEKYLLNNLDTILSDAVYEAEIRPKRDKDDTFTIRKKLTDKMARIGQRFEDGDISLEEYRIKRDAIKAEIAALDEAEDDNASLPSLPGNWKDIYNELDEEHKRVFWQTILKNIIVPPTSEEPFVINFSMCKND